MVKRGAPSAGGLKFKCSRWEAIMLLECPRASRWIPNSFTAILSVTSVSSCGGGHTRKRIVLQGSVTFHILILLCSTSCLAGFLIPLLNKTVAQWQNISRKYIRKKCLFFSEAVWLTGLSRCSLTTSSLKGEQQQSVNNASGSIHLAVSTGNLKINRIKHKF